MSAIDMTGGASPLTSPVVPATVPLPRRRPRPPGQPDLGPLADASSAPRIVVTNKGASSGLDAGGTPLAVQPIVPAGTGDGTDPYADVPRIKARTGFGRAAYSAASGIAAVPENATPLSALAESFVGAQNAGQLQTEQERTRQIDDINRGLALDAARAERERNATNDAATNAEKNSQADLNEAYASGKVSRYGGGKSGEITDALYAQQLIQEEQASKSLAAVLLQNGQLRTTDDVNQFVKSRVDAKRAELDAMRAKGQGAASSGESDTSELDALGIDGFDQAPTPVATVAAEGATASDAADLGASAFDTPTATTKSFGGGEPPKMMRVEDKKVVVPLPRKTRDITINGTPIDQLDPEGAKTDDTGKPAPTEKNGATADNVNGDGSLQLPFRVKDWNDPTLKAKIGIGSHYVWHNPDTGKDEIRIRDR